MSKWAGDELKIAEKMEEEHRRDRGMLHNLPKNVHGAHNTAWFGVGVASRNASNAKEVPHQGKQENDSVRLGESPQTETETVSECKIMLHFDLAGNIF